jgi:hypothetical protein
MSRLLFALALASLLLAPSPAVLAEPPPSPASPGGAALAFYAFHMTHDMGFSKEGVAQRETWLSPDLLSICRKYLARPSSPDEVPPIDGDPFTDSQEYPTSFKVGRVRRTGGTASVEISFSGPAANKGRVHLILVQTKGSWLVDDVRYVSGPSFRKLLAQ